MKKRTFSRELSLQVLYQVDVTKEDINDILECFHQFKEVRSDIADFAKFLINKTLSNLKYIDNLIKKNSHNWSLKRMATIDRNILRLAICEILYIEDIPPKVSINEAIELAKKFGDEDSKKFINGILDKVLRDCIQTTKKLSNE